MKIYIHRNGQQLGPYTPEELKTAVATGAVSLLDLAWWEGQATWTPLGQTPFAPAPAVPPVPGTVSAPSPLFPSAAAATPGSFAHGQPGVIPHGGMPIQSKLATASLVCSCLGLLCGIFTVIPGIIMGHMSLAEIKRNPAIQGQGQAIAGLVIGYIMLFLTVISLAAIFTLQALGTQVKDTFKDLEQKSDATTNAPDSGTNSAPANQ